MKSDYPPSGGNICLLGVCVVTWSKTTPVCIVASSAGNWGRDWFSLRGKVVLGKERVRACQTEGDLGEELRRSHLTSPVVMSAVNRAASQTILFSDIVTVVRKRCG